MLIVGDWVVRFGGEDEVGWDELGTLVQELVEGVLCVGCGFTEEDWAGGIFHHLVIAGDGFSVGFHGELLEVGWEAVEVLVESRFCKQNEIRRADKNLRGNQVSLSTKHIRVVNTQKASNDWDILLQRSGSEVHIHSMCTRQELMEVLESNVDSHTQANGRPDRVTTSNPALESEHVLGIDTKFRNFGLVGREGNEVLGNVSLSICLLQEPFLGAVGICGSFCRGEGLGRDQEKRGLGI